MVFIFSNVVDVCVFYFLASYESNASQDFGGPGPGLVQNLNPQTVPTPCWGQSVVLRKGLHIQMARLVVGGILARFGGDLARFGAVWRALLRGRKVNAFLAGFWHGFGASWRAFLRGPKISASG